MRERAGLRRASTEGVAGLSLVLVFMIAACGSERTGGAPAPEDIVLPRLTGAPPHHPAAAIEGTFVEDEGCLESPADCRVGLYWVATPLRT
jgi:hypothetical protein